MELLPEMLAEGRRILLFSQFTSMLTLIEAELKKRNIAWVKLTGQSQSVWVVKLVAQGTIEERILGLQERKAALAESMYSGAVGRKQPLFTEGDLAELLKPLSV